MPGTRSSTSCYSDSTAASKQAEHAASHLLSLSQTNPLPSGPVTTTNASPELSFDTSFPQAPLPDVSDLGEDGLFRPGSTYLNLHSTLRHYLFQESRSTDPTRFTTPCSDSDEGAPGECLGEVVGKSGEDDSFLLTKEQEGILWVNWLDEVAPWVSQIFLRICGSRDFNMLT